MLQSAISIFINVLSSGIVLVIVLTWNKWIIPWFKSLVYRGMKINGTWKIQQSDEMVDGVKLKVKRTVDIIIRQNANELNGDATARTVGNDTQLEDILYYDVKGEIKDRFVSLTFIPKEQSKIACSVFLLEAVGDGSILRGYRTFYGHKRMKVCAVSCDLVKLKD